MKAERHLCRDSIRRTGRGYGGRRCSTGGRFTWDHSYQAREAAAAAIRIGDSQRWSCATPRNLVATPMAT